MKKPLVLLAVLALSTGAFAQQAEANLPLAREVIAAMQADKMIDRMLGQMKQMAVQSMALGPDATPEQRQKAEQVQNKIMEISTEAAKAMIGKMDHIYAEVYTATELQAMKTFFTSPEGQAMMAKQPQLMAKMQPLMMEMQRDIMPKVQQVMQEAQAAANPAPAPLPAPAK